jgi:cell division protein FtsB
MIHPSNRNGLSMSQRLSISATVLLALAVALGLYFAFAAVQGPSGILRRIQIEAETLELAAERDRLKAEVQEMQNLTRRMSDEYLDLDLLDERAREMLGLIRADEVILR